MRKRWVKNSLVIGMSLFLIVLSFYSSAVVTEEYWQEADSFQKIDEDKKKYDIDSVWNTLIRNQENVLHRVVLQKERRTSSERIFGNILDDVYLLKYDRIREVYFINLLAGGILLHSIFRRQIRCIQELDGKK